MKRIIAATVLILALLAGCGGQQAEEQTPAAYIIDPVDFSKVTFTDELLSGRIDVNNATTILHNYQQCEETGRLDNFAFAGGLKEGKQTGYFFNDSDVFKNIEAAAYALQAGENPELEAATDRVIELIAAAQEEDGYLYTARTAYNPDNPPPGGAERWSNIKDGHELYCVGHLYEAAVAHFQATGKRTLLDVALKNADLILETFGPGKNEQPPGHQEIEIGLVKLYHLTGEEKYLDLAEFFLEMRGRNLEERESNGEYDQDHLPVAEQTEVVGHAVRANYQYSAMADVAAATGNNDYLQALHTLWENANAGKIYVTGGYGATGHGEAYGEPFELPNMTAYCESCSSIAGMFWNYRMFRLTGQARFMDSFERTLYNNFMASTALEGDHFFYVNPLESDGGHQRNQWFKCACCPPNIARFFASLGGYVYATGENSLYVNLFAANRGTVDLGDQQVIIEQETRYPWDGSVAITVTPESEARFNIAVRRPVWATGKPVHTDLYSYLDGGAEPVIYLINGQEFTPELKAGYAVFDRTWAAGDKLEFELPMPVRRVLAHEKIEVNNGLVALERGPVVYCLEWPDVEDGAVRNAIISDDAGLVSRFRGDLLGGVQVISGKAKAYYEQEEGVDTKTVEFEAIPYFAWANRGPGEMRVWLAREDDAVEPRPLPTLASQAVVSASAGREAEAVNDQLEPRAADDARYPYFYLRPHEGADHWIEYQFGSAETVSGVDVYWLEKEDTVFQLPESWRLIYFSNGEWLPVEMPEEPEITAGEYNSVRFEPISTTALRLELKLRDQQGGGIHEWRVY